ncbi:SEC14-like protein 5 isoform X1 [Ricinus communis]|nr:SEC14-like protein 5 isoform X1 [Ricinus communis]
MSMGDPLCNSGSSGNSEVKTLAVRNKVYKRNLGASDPKSFPLNVYKHIASLSHSRNTGAAIGHIAIFLLKVAALETVRRVSRSKCPPLWRGLQAMQFLCYPPFKWIQKWAPLKGLVKGVQMFSRPLLFLSVATVFSEELECDTETSNNVSGSQAHSDSETDSDSNNVHSSPDSRSNDGEVLMPKPDHLELDLGQLLSRGCIPCTIRFVKDLLDLAGQKYWTSDVILQDVPSENWLMQLHKELVNQGITLPERINEDELHRFFTAANGDFSCFLSSIKKTIRWRENYRILSEEELEMWSNMVFWHGYDIENRPCLVVRLGLACLNLPSHERPRFAQAVISQVEHGVLHLVDKDNPQITVLVDCDGISPLRLPMQMLRSCSSLLQNNFPNRLGHLLVIRLPPVVRVIAQTFFQVLKPVTQKKLRIEGNMYRRVICEYLQTIPSYLGGSCTCKICSSISSIHVTRQRHTVNEIRRAESTEYLTDAEDIPSARLTFEDDVSMNENWDQLLRTAVIGVLMVWAFIALIAVLHDPESRPF